MPAHGSQPDHGRIAWLPVVALGALLTTYAAPAPAQTGAQAAAQTGVQTEIDAGPSETAGPVATAEYGQLLDPLLTAGERSIWAGLADDAERARFVRAFWEARDPTPGTVVNERRDIFETRARRALQEMGEGTTPGYATDRGRVLLVYGLPDAQEMRRLPAGSPPTLIWTYSREPELIVRFEQEGEAFVLRDSPELSDEAFLASLGDDLRLRLATAVGGRSGALTESGPGLETVGPAQPHPDVAPEVKIWMQLVFSGQTREDLELRRRLYFFPAEEGTYLALAFEVGKAGLEFAVTEPPVVDADATDETAEGDARPPAAAAQAERVPTAAELAAAAGIEPLSAPDPEEPRAELRVFGAFLQGEPGKENTVHSFVVPYSLWRGMGDADTSPALSLAVTLFPGTYRLAWGVMDTRTGKAVTRDEIVEVPDYSRGELALTTPLMATGELRDATQPLNATTVYEGVRLGNVLVKNDVDDVFDRDATIEVVTVVTGWASDPSAPGKPKLEVVYRVLRGLEGDESLARLPEQVLDFSVLGQQIPLGQVDRLRPGRSYRIEIRVRDLVGGGEVVARAPLHLRPAGEPDTGPGGR